MEKKTRDIRLDLIRALAGFLVVSVHFFWHNDYYAQPMAGERMLVMTVMRMAFMTCVPLFLLLTGWLCGKKELSGRYYLSIVPILLTYALCALVCLEVQQVRGTAPQGKTLVQSFFNFSAAPYGWYVEMYVGLFLLIPFLNILWRGLETKGRQKALIASLLALTALPGLLNARGDQFPNWWVNAYPLLYYFLGAWLREHDPRPRTWALLVGLAASVTANGGIVFWLNRGDAFVWREFSDWAGPLVVVESCLLFLLLLRLPVDKAPRWLRWLIGKAAGLTLGIYLLSWCFDTWLYPKLIAHVPQMTDRLLWYFVMVPAVYLCSALAAQGVEWVRKGVTWCINKLCPKAELR